MKQNTPLWATALLMLSTAAVQAQEAHSLHWHEQLQNQTLLAHSGAIREYNPRFAAPFVAQPQGAVLADLLARNAHENYRLGHTLAAETIHYFLTKVPVDERRPILSLERAALYMAEGDFHRARNLLEKVDESTLSRAERTEWQVRTAYALLRTNRGGDKLDPLFAEAAQANNRWGRIAKLYVASSRMAKGDLQAAEAIYRSLSGDRELAPETRIGMAALSYYSGDYAKAVAEVGEIERVEPRLASNPSLLQVAGNAYYRLGDAPNASKYLERFIENSSEFASPEDYLLLGAAYMEQQRYGEAIDPLKQATQGKGATGYAASLYLGRALRDQGNYPQAIVAYERAVEESAPTQVREAAMYEMALVMRSSGQSNFGQDVRIAERFLNTFPSSKHRPTMEKFLTEFYLSNTDYATSLASIQRLKKTTPTIDEARQYVLNHLALDALSQGKFSQAAKYVEDALDKQSVSSLYKGESLLIQADILRAQGDYAGSIRPLTAFLALPESAQRPNRSEAQYYLGYALFNGGRYAEAKGYFSSSAQDSKQGALRQSDAYTRLGDCQYATNALDAAFASYERAISLAPSQSSDALLRLAEINGLRKQYSRQIALLDRLITSFPDSPAAAQASYQKGRAYLLQGNNDAAEKAFVATASQYSQSEEGRLALLQLALLYYNTQRVEKSLDTYTQLMHRYPKSAEAATAFTHLKSICIEEGRTDYLQGAVQKTGGAFSLSESESRELEFKALEREYKRRSQEVEPKMEAFIARYRVGSDVSTIQKYLADLAFERGDKDRAYTLYTALAAEVRQLPRAAQSSVLQRLGALQIEQDDKQAAYDTYHTLYTQSSDRSLRMQAAEKAAEMALSMEKWKTAIAVTTDALTALGEEGAERLHLLRGNAHSELGECAKALAEYKTILAKTDLSAGAEATVHYATLQAKGSGKEKQEAKQLLNKFIEKGTPHEYWLARGILALAEIYRSEGDKVTADQYVESLKNNYPKREDDILERIARYQDQQLGTPKR